MQPVIYSSRVFFTPNRALSEVALVGFPGTEGNLRIVAASQVRGQDVVLLIPFKLAQCPLGYFPPPGAASLEEVRATQRGFLIWSTMHQNYATGIT